MNSVQMGSLMQQMEAMRTQAKAMTAQQPSALSTQQTEKPASFSEILSRSLDQVNGLQNASQAMSTAFVKGETDNLAGVMISQQKARIATTAMIEVRNKLLESYREVMNMSV